LDPQDYRLVKTGEDSQPGINGGLTPKMHQESGGTGGRVTNTIDVPSIDDFSKISTEGGKVVQPKMAIPGGIGYLAICEDTEGNSFGIMTTESRYNDDLQLTTHHDLLSSRSDE
jgi:uncharacterized protein